MSDMVVVPGYFHFLSVFLTRNPNKQNVRAKAKKRRKGEEKKHYF